LLLAAFFLAGVISLFVGKGCGVLYSNPSVEGLIQGILDFESRENSFDVQTLKKQASLFSKERFQKEWKEAVLKVWNSRA
jgi:hypothetical protein